MIWDGKKRKNKKIENRKKFKESEGSQSFIVIHRPVIFGDL